MDAICYPHAPGRAPVWLGSGGAAFGQSGSSGQAVLEQHCLSCHGPARMSGLDLRDRQTALAGGKRGPAIVPGKPDQSVLYHAVLRDGELQMPPGKAAFLRKMSRRCGIGSPPALLGLRRRRAQTPPGGRSARSLTLFRRPSRATGWVRTPIDSLYSEQARREGAQAGDGSQPPNSGPPRVLRSARVAAHARRSRASSCRIRRRTHMKS